MKGKSLCKLSLSIHEEAEEAVFELMQSLFGQAPVMHVDVATKRTTAFVYLDDAKHLEEPNLARLRQGLRSMREAGLSTGKGRIRLSQIRHEDWAESWKHHFKPFEIGKALLIRPSWNRRRPRKNQQLIILDPGLSFGTGHHPTTRFCLDQLVRLRQPQVEQSFLDMGTGSGILAIAAAKLGFRPVEAFDFDPEAVRIARENALHNQAGPQLVIRQRDLTRLSERGPCRFDIIAANLTDDILRENRRKIINRLKPGGILILAGILQKQFAAIRHCFELEGAKLASWKREKEWKSGAFSF